VAVFRPDHRPAVALDPACACPRLPAGAPPACGGGPFPRPQGSDTIPKPIGPGSRPDALHVALATIGRVDVLVGWNFRHIANLGKIRLFNAVDLEQGYGLIEIRTPREVLADEDVI